MKLILAFFSILAVSSTSLASEVCKLLDGRRVSLSQNQVLTLEGFSSSPVTKIDRNQYKTTSGEEMILDLDQKTLEVNKVRMHLVDCFHTDAY